MKDNNRIESLDVIRGFAVLGILLMNIQSFSMVGQAYLNPTAYGDLTGLNKWIWILSHIFADSKFMSLFSMLFGASILLITESAERKTGASAGLHYRRNFGLLIIGLIHAYGMWYGDILTPYAICAMLLYPLRRMSVRKLLVTGVIIFSISSFIELFFGFSMPYWPRENVTELLSSWMPTQASIDRTTSAYIGDFGAQMARRIKETAMMHTTVFLTIYFWRINGLMLLGMALYKSGFLTGDFSMASYRKIGLVTGLMGFGLVIYGLIQNFSVGWTVEYSMFIGSQFNYWGSLFIAIFYVCVVLVTIKADALKSLRYRLGNVGRMALTNYLGQTIIATFIFYGFGLGLYGQIDRTGQLLIVLGVWAFQLIFSPIWLRHFHYGPIEWLWRSFSQMKWQVMKK
jgi:uncharacterized protein